MVDTLQSKWAPPLVGLVLFLLTYFFLAREAGRIVLTQMPTVTKTVIEEPVEDPVPAPVVMFAPPGPSWVYVNPEIDLLVGELREEKARLASKTLDLGKQEARVQSEKAELQATIKSLERMQKEFDNFMIRIRTEETANLTKMARVFSSMAPSEAIIILQEMNNEELVKILAHMREHKAGELLGLFAQQGTAGAQRAAEISDVLRKAIANKDSATTQGTRPVVSPEDVDRFSRSSRIYAAMPPANAYAILKQMQDEDVARILMFMPEGRASGILATMGAQGPAGANRATQVSSLMQEVMTDQGSKQIVENSQTVIEADEAVRLTRMAKMYSAMPQDNAMKILGETDDFEFAKILYFMKGDTAAGILGMLAQQGGQNGTTRATILSDLLSKMRTEAAP